MSMTAILAAITTLAVLSVSVDGAPAHQRPDITGQVTFLYYDDLDAAEHFYRTVVGLESTFDEGWVRIFAITETSFVGLVDAQRGTHRTSDDKPVMLSVVVSDVDAWHERIRGHGVEVVSGPADSEAVPVRAFLVKDPGGYTVEFFQWRAR